MEIEKKKRGGRREGAGRPKGTNQYGETTKPMRVPLSMLDNVNRFLNKKGYKIPHYSSPVPAGTPADLEDYLEEMVDIADYMVPNPDKTYMVTVTGDSMIKVGIHEGDLLIVDTAIEPKHKDIVIASIGNEMTVKRLHHNDGTVMLLPENDAYEPIIMKDGEELMISGVVTFTLRKQTG